MIGVRGRSRPSVAVEPIGVDDVLAGDDLAEVRVSAVEPRRGLGGDDEELAAVRPGPAFAIASEPFTILWALNSSANW